MKLRGCCLVGYFGRPSAERSVGEFALTAQICAGSGTLRSRKFGARLSGKSVFDLCSEFSDVG
jgi:hypothetical protein